MTVAVHGGVPPIERSCCLMMFATGAGTRSTRMTTASASSLDDRDAVRIDARLGEERARAPGRAGMQSNEGDSASFTTFARDVAKRRSPPELRAGRLFCPEAFSGVRGGFRRAGAPSNFLERGKRPVVSRILISSASSDSRSRERLRDLVEILRAPARDATGPLVAFVHERADLVVDLARRLFAVVAFRTAISLPRKICSSRSPYAIGPMELLMPHLHDHLSDEPRGLFDVLPALRSRSDWGRSPPRRVRRAIS